MAEVLVEFPDIVNDERGVAYRARAVGGESRGTWQGWLEFEPVDGGEVIRGPRETTQPNRVDTHYWATGLTPVYLEGALHRAQHPLVLRQPPPPRAPVFDEPAEAQTLPPANDAVLNPFSVYQKGETLLRRQLAALSSWHLVNIIRAYGLPVTGTDPNHMAPSLLIEAIIEGVRRRNAEAVTE